MKTLKYLKYSLLLSVCIIAISCTKPDKEPYKPATFYSYYPLDEGITRIYNADSFLYLTVRQHIRFQIKEVIKDSYTNSGGEKIYRIERFTRPDSLSSWKVLDVITASRNSEEALLTIGNSTFVKLLFPFSTSSSWDYNKYNSLDTFHNQLATYSDINSHYTLGSRQYDSSTLVTYLNDTASIITKYYNAERYAARIGLIELEDKHLDLQPPKKPNDPWDTSGYIYHQSLINFSK